MLHITHYELLTLCFGHFLQSTLWLLWWALKCFCFSPAKRNVHDFFIAWYIYSQSNSSGLIHVYFGLKREQFMWKQPEPHSRKVMSHGSTNLPRVTGSSLLKLLYQLCSDRKFLLGTEKISCLSVRADKLFRFHTISTEQGTGIWSPRCEPLMAHLSLCYSFVGVLVWEHLQPLITQRLVVAETCNDICPAGTEAVSLLQLLSLCVSFGSVTQTLTLIP